MDRDRFEDLLAAYALRALSEEERRELEDYLDSHPERRAEAEELAALANLMALAPAEHEPSPELRENIMRVVESEAAPQQAGRPSALDRLRESLTLRRLGLAAAALLAVALLSWNVLLQSEVQDLRGQLAESQTTYAMQGTGTASTAEAEIVELENGRAVLVAENIPSVPEDQTFQIWVIEDGTPEPGGTFRPEDGTTAAALDTPITGAEAVAVTVEPAGGSDQPTSDPVLQTNIPT